jgi:hypothetical protein
MKCKHCGHRYGADIAQPAPGGSSAPGGFFVAALIGAGITLILFLTGSDLGKWLALGLTLVVLCNVFVAWKACQGPAGGSSTGGETCPECRGLNRVWPWSF